MTETLLEVATAAARAGGRALMERFARVRTIHFKGERDLVTDGDRAAEAAVIAHIRAAFPDHRILSEEAGSLDGPGEILWIIDPLDGTTNFAHGLPCFCVSGARRMTRRSAAPCTTRRATSCSPPSGARAPGETASRSGSRRPPS